MAHSRSYKTDAIVLRQRALGEADRIFTLLSTERGKMTAVAKGVRRMKSHFAGRLEFGNECRLTMHRGRSLDVVVTADLLGNAWLQLVEPERFAVSSLLAELVDAFCEPDLPVPEVYALLGGALAAVAASDEPQHVLPRFSLRLLSLLGFEPPLEQCVRCARDFTSGIAWADPDAGGLICERCRERWRDLIELSCDDITNLRGLATAKSSGSRAELKARPQAARAIDALLTHQLGRTPKAGLHLSEFVTPPQ